MGSGIDPAARSSVELTSGTFAGGDPNSMNIHGQVVGHAESEGVLSKPVTS